MSEAGLPLKVCIAVLTRRRPFMLRSLLQSWADLAIPEHIHATFVVIENDDSAYSEGIVQEFREQKTLNISYSLEPRKGIPYARNRAIDFVVENDYELLLFVDDDETVRNDWLVHMIDAYRQSSALLIGGPVEAIPPQPSLSGLSNILFSGIRCRYRRKAIRAQRKHAEGNMAGITIVTSNWLGHRDLFTKYGLRFDESMHQSGGSDAKFDRETRALGLSRSWAPLAYVQETIPEPRISLLYQYQRARDQSIVNCQQKVSRSRKSALIADSFILPLRALAILALLCAVPMTVGSSLISVARNAGWIVGRFNARLGRESRLYIEVTGE